MRNCLLAFRVLPRTLASLDGHMAWVFVLLRLGSKRSGSARDSITNHDLDDVLKQLVQDCLAVLVLKGNQRLKRFKYLNRWT